MGETGCADKIVEMARHANEKFRQTAVWVMQETRDPRFIAVLNELSQESATVQVSVARALASLKMANAQQQDH